jgi:hypothetical protein
MDITRLSGSEPPAAIVIKVGDTWRIAIPFRGADRGPDGVVWVYSFTVGRPYRSEAAATEDAALIVARGRDV